MNKIVEHQTQVPAPPGDPFSAYGAAASAGGTPFLKFVKGHFLYGVDEEELPLGTRLVPHMSELRAGFVKWQAKEPVAEEMVLVADGVPAPARESLGDTDESLWETDAIGTPNDPWQITNHLPLKNPATGDEYIFVTGSKGGIGAIGRLCTNYGRAVDHRNAGRLPIIELGDKTYKHPNYGTVHTPIFPVVAWQDEARLVASEEPKPADPELDDEIPF